MNTAHLEKLLFDADQGNLDALIQLDEMGFIISAEESAENFTARIRTFLKNLSVMEDDLKKKGVFEKEGISFSEKQRIPVKIFKEASERCRSLYDFSIDWVPGFFMNPDFGLLFGGCAFCYYPDFFALFIIRDSFRKKDKWLIYNRKELLAHELCHIARVALDSNTYEETFAYQTAASGFRKLLGGIFLRQSDSFLFLGSVFAFLLGRMAQTFLFPNLPGMLFMLLPVLVILWLGIRYAMLMNTLGTARKNLESLFGKKALSVLFRCSDPEIHKIATLKQDELRDYVNGQNTLNWQVIRRRFMI